jgi:hypothetical protein
MELRLIDRKGKCFIEGPAGQSLLRDVADTVQLIEACFNHRTKCILLYSENLTDNFFVLSSQEAGSILQKLRNYDVRMAVVWSHDVQGLSHTFRDLLLEENRQKYFHLFKERQEAEAWLLED